MKLVKVFKEGMMDERKCEECGGILKREYESHDNIYRTPDCKITCTQYGLNKFVCVMCGWVYVDEEEIKALPLVSDE